MPIAGPGSTTTRLAGTAALSLAMLALAACGSKPAAPPPPILVPVQAPPPPPAVQVPVAAPPAKPLVIVEPMDTREMQQRLADHGFKPGPADGVMGKRTLTALKAFQETYGLPVSGKLDDDTILLLRARKLAR